MSELVHPLHYITDCGSLGSSVRSALALGSNGPGFGPRCGLGVKTWFSISSHVIHQTSLSKNGLVVK